MFLWRLGSCAQQSVCQRRFQFFFIQAQFLIYCLDFTFFLLGQAQHLFKLAVALFCYFGIAGKHLAFFFQFATVFFQLVFPVRLLSALHPFPAEFFEQFFYLHLGIYQLMF